MQNVVTVREWNADEFHRKVMELEAKGYVSRLDSYRVTAEMDPETGVIVHLHSIELNKNEDSPAK